MTLSTAGITGIDGHSPIHEPDGLWKTWAISEIYLGNEGAKKYVPKIDDYIVDPNTDERWKVISIDPTTMVPELEPIKPVFVGAFGEMDLLLGVGPGTQSDTYRMYVDKSVMPYRAAVDARLAVAGSACSFAKLFRGSLIHGNEKCISSVYDNSGNLLGNAIPLELVAYRTEDGQNVTVKTVPPFSTTEDLPDGELVTAVFYSDVGHVVSKRQLLVENTAFIRAVENGVKYITGISLRSPFLSQSDPKVIQYPLNVPLNGLGLMGVVHYSDGSERELPVDGTKFTIYGFEHFVSTIIGQKLPLVLKYTLSSDEVVYGASVAGDRFITEEFTATTVKADGAYTIKLFCYPEWIDELSGYRLRWWLYNLERQTAFEVTPYVRINANTGIFDPLAYGVNQHLSVSLNLKDANPAFKAYTHVQAIDIVLNSPGSSRTTNWLVGYEPAQNPFFGMNNHADTWFVNQNLVKVRLGMGETDLAVWLDRLYFATKPLVDINRELVAPTPTHFALTIDGADIVFTISQWNSEHLVNATIVPNSTLVVKFIKRTPDNDIQLAVAGLPVYQQN